MRIRDLMVLVALATTSSPARAANPTAREIHAELVDDDPWGIGGGDVEAHATVIDGSRTRELVFAVRSLRYDPPLVKSLLRFNAPADVAGVGFLQTQKRDADDDRYLYMPELHRSRRVAAVRRAERFMGTDYTYGDLDRRDLRNARAEVVGSERLGNYDTLRLALTPTDQDALYGRIDVWVRRDNLRPLRYVLYDRDLVRVKTVTALEIKKVDGRWFTTRSVMLDHRTGSKTEIQLLHIRKSNHAEQEFTVRELERL